MACLELKMEFSHVTSSYKGDKSENASFIASLCVSLRGEKLLNHFRKNTEE